MDSKSLELGIIQYLVVSTWWCSSPSSQVCWSGIINMRLL
jgi:hypothetical protein